MIFNPREYFTIVRQLADHTDSTTYYVRAVVRNSRTDAILATVELVNRGSGRFTKEYQVPADVSGLGLYIDITTSVYSDSGYTTKASTYGDENDTYLVYDRAKHSGGGGGGGADVDYKKIEKIVKTVEFPEIPKPEKVDLKPVLAAVSKLGAEMEAAIKNIEIPEQEKINFAPILTKIEDVQQSLIDAIDEKEVTEVDLAPVLEKIDALAVTDLEKAAANLIKIVTELKQDVKNYFSADSEMEKKVANMKDGLEQFLTAALPGSRVKQEDPRIKALTRS